MRFVEGVCFSCSALEPVLEEAPRIGCEKGICEKDVIYASKFPLARTQLPAPPAQMPVPSDLPHRQGHLMVPHAVTDG